MLHSEVFDLWRARYDHEIDSCTFSHWVQSASAFQSVSVGVLALPLPMPPFKPVLKDGNHAGMGGKEVHCVRTDSMR